MTTRTRAVLDQPTGTEGLYLEDAWRHRNTVSRLGNILEEWGYFPVHSPLIDYHDAFSELVRSDAAREIYRLIDREGELIAIRSDATLFLAKHMARFVRPDALPVRVYYAEAILRHARREDISRNEYFQIGAELIGETGVAGELETLSLAMKTIDAVLPGRCVLHIGHRGVVDRITESFSSDDQASIQDALKNHDRVSLLGRLTRVYDRTHAESLARILMSIGNADVIAEQTATELRGLPDTLSRALQPDIQHVLRLATRLKDALAVMNTETSADAIRVDFSEFGAQSYHTGIAFRAYAEGAEAAVASGGRYDSLYGHFGLPAAAVGFSVMLRRLERLSPIEALPDVQPLQASTDSFVAQLAEAERRRQNGERVSFDFTSSEAPHE